MPLTNAWDSKRTNGYSLVDLVGSATGNFGGTVLPVIIPNGHIKFTGGHSTTPGNWGRIAFATTPFRHTGADNFSILVQCTPTAYSTANNYIFVMLDQSALAGYYGFNFNAQEFVHHYMRSTDLAINYSLAESKLMAVEKLVSLCIANSQADRFFSVNTYQQFNTADVTTNLYSASSQPLLGCGKQGASYINDVSMRFYNMKLFNHKLGNAEIVQYQNQLHGVV